MSDKKEFPEGMFTTPPVLVPDPDGDSDVPLIRIANGGEGPDLRVRLPPRRCVEPEQV